jgi:integrase
MAGHIERVDRPKPWRARYRGIDGRSHSRSFRTKVEAERWLRERLTDLDRGLYVDPRAGSRTLRDWSGSWLGGLDLKAKTLDGYEEVLGTLVLPVFGDVPVVRITSAAVREWTAAMRQRGLSTSRMRQARSVLRQILAVAVQDGALARNPVDGVKVGRVPEREARFLTAEQVEALAFAAESRKPGSGLVVTTLAWVGLRWGELVALKAGRVDPQRRRIEVVEAATEVGGRLVFGPPKTHERRVVAAPKFLTDLLAANIAGLDATDLVFTAPSGGPLRGSNFRTRVWAGALGDTSIGEGLRPHDLRHTAASLMIATGASIKTVQRQLGHASAAMTLDRYGHLYDDDLDALADALDVRHAEAAAPQTRHKGPLLDGQPLGHKGFR